jgi:large subunit ribosomal protein L29
MKTPELRELSIKDLKERLETEKANFVRMKINHAVSPIEDMSKIGKTRKHIARMHTIISQKVNEDKK